MKYFYFQPHTKIGITMKNCNDKTIIVIIYGQWASESKSCVKRAHAQFSGYTPAHLLRGYYVEKGRIRDQTCRAVIINPYEMLLQCRFNDANGVGKQIRPVALLETSFLKNV
jgi:hypothetical protein